MSDGIGEIKELRALVTELADRLDATSTSLQKATTRLHQVEGELAELRKRVDADTPEDTVIATSAVVSAYLGNRGRVKVIRYNHYKTWVTQGRQIRQQCNLRQLEIFDNQLT